MILEPDDPTGPIVTGVLLGGTMLIIGLVSAKRCLQAAREWGSPSRASVTTQCEPRVEPQPPTVTAVEEDHGLPRGTNRVTVRGTNFEDGATVTFGGRAGTKVTFVDPQSLQADVPAGDLGPTDVVVTNPNGLSSLDTGNGRYSYALPRWRATIVSHGGGRTQDVALRQFVNLADRAASNEGSTITLEVEPHDVTLGIQGQELTVVVSFPATNSQRNTPRPQLIVAGHLEPSTVVDAAPGVDELVYRKKLSLPVDQGRCQFQVQLGLAGGDLCHIKVGFDDGEDDDELWIENWRRLESEFVVPHSTIRQPWKELVNNNDDAPAPHPSLVAAIKAILDPLKIELVFPPDGGASFTADDINALMADRDGADTFVLQGAAVHALCTADRPCTFLKPSDMDGLRARVLPHAVPSPQRFALVWTDMMAKTLSDDSAELELLDPGEYFTYFTPDDAGPKNQTTPAGMLAALRYPLCTDAGDLWGVEKLYWKIVGWRKVGDVGWIDDPHAGEMVGHDWVALDQAHAAEWELHEVTPGSAVEVNEWVEFVTMKDFRMKIPNPPSQLLQIGGVEHKILVTVKIRHFKVGGNANAIQGKIRMTPTLGLGVPAGVARTLCHEIGHNLGHTYFENQGALTDRRGRHPSHQIPGVAFDPGIDAGGNFYAGKGHRGAHCAYGIKQAGKDLTVKNFGPAYSIDTNCVLYGAGDQKSATPFTYCPECTRYIRASDARDISKNWKAE